MAATTPYEQVMEDLLRGQDFAAELQPLLRDSPKAGLIVDQILHAFSRAIDAAKAMADQVGSEVQSEVTCAGGGGGGKRKAAAAGAGDRKGGTARRRTQDSSVRMVTTNDLEDGHAWRKYGQKEIQNSKHPKAYFRCTHKYDQQCAAQRQVQRCDDAPESFRVTYIGLHTCRDPATLAPVVVHHHDAAGAAGVLPAGSRLISFVGAPNAASTPTTSTTTTTTGAGHANHHHGEGGALLSLPPLKLEGGGGGGGGGGDQEEVLSSLTPAGSARNPVATPGGADQGDVTSGLHFLGGRGVDDLGFAMDDDTFDLDEIEQIFRI